LRLTLEFINCTLVATMSSPLELNRQHWDEVTRIHARNNVYGIDEFKAGGCRLHRVEREELGDVSGKSLLHLQCHFGLDTLSWARRGVSLASLKEEGGWRRSDWFQGSGDWTRAI
jgi:hypothetical protein